MEVAVVTCSTRSAAGTRPDTSGQILVNGLQDSGHAIAFRSVVPDDIPSIQAALHQAIAAGAAAIFITGGTGLTPNDVTPEAVKPLLDKEIPGIAEALRSSARDRVPTSILSRGVAGLVGTVLVVTLPGSPGGARDGLEVVLPILNHAIEQVAGGDHVGPTE